MTYLPDNIYKTCLKSLPIVCVDVVIFDITKEKVLLFKRENNPLKNIYYTLGGRVLKNESLINTAIRKLKDEAGIIINRSDLNFGGYMEEFYENSVYSGVDTHNINIFYSYIVSEDIKVQLDSQHSDCKWVDIKSKSIHLNIHEKINLILNSK